MGLDLYDRNGKEISMDAYLMLLEDREYKIVQQDTLANGRWVSTVWLGMNHQYGYGPPLIFETMVFPAKGEWSEMLCERYATEEQAKEGHLKALSLAGDDEWHGYDDD